MFSFAYIRFADVREPGAHRRSRRTAWAAALILPLLCGAGGVWAQSADLVLAQHVVSPDPVPAGGVATITMTLQNNGPGAAASVSLTDTIPPGSTFVGMVASDAGTCTGAVPYACSWPTVPNLASRTVTLQVRLPSAAVWENNAVVASTTADPNMGNNALTRNITAVAAADLRIDAVSSVGPATIAAGTPYTYTLTVDNNVGPNALPAGEAPKVTFNVPAGSSVTAVPTGAGWTCTPATAYPRTAPAGGPGGDLITCTRNAGADSLGVGASFPAITVPAVANVTGTVTGAFTVGSTFPDGDTSNNTDTVNVSLSDGTDMSITKTASLAAGGGGTQATFTLRARQEGGAAPTGVTVTDTLPGGLTYASHSAVAPWVCNFAAPTLTCNYPGTYNGGPFTNLPDITLVANVTGVGDIPNTGIVAATPIDPVGANNTSTVTVNNTADLRIDKSASFSPVVVGQAYNWNIDVRNYGPMPVMTGQTITVNETVPAGMTINGPASSGWSCTGLPAVGGATFSCTHVRASNLGVNAYAPTLSLPSVNTVPGALTNNACLALSGAGPTEAGDAPGFQRNCVGTGITATDGGVSADLEIIKVASGTVAVGQPLTYTLTATNRSGTVTATSVHIYDTVNNLLSSGALPGLVSITPSQGTCTPAAPANVSAASIDCTIGTLTPGASATVTVVVRPANTTAATLSRGNTADVNSLDVGDPVRGNNRSTVNSDVLPRVDATVTKTVNPSSDVRVGQPTVYTVTARNLGPSMTSALNISDVMPPNTAFISVGTPSNGGTCGTVPTVGSTGETLACSWANVVSGGSRTVTFTVRPLAAALNTTISNTVNVTVGASDTETDLTNNSSTAITNAIDSLVDILVQKTDSVDPVVLGALTKYTITMRNAGPSYGTHLVMTDTFPVAGNTARFSYQGNLTATVAGVAVPAPLPCTEPTVGAMTGTLTCTFPTIAVGIANEVVLTYDMRAENIITAGAYSGTQGNHVEVGVDENETAMTNNQVSEDTTTRRDPPGVGNEIDLGIVKTTSPARALPGTEFDYTLTVTNHQAPGSGRDVVPGNGAQVTDTLPAGLSFVSAPGCTYDNATRQVVCIISNLAAGANTAFTLRVRVDTPYVGPASVPNTAHVDMPGDPVPGNDDSTVNKPMGELDPTAIPTLSEWGLILLSMLLAGFALRRVSQTSRRRL